MTEREFLERIIQKSYRMATLNVPKGRTFVQCIYCSASKPVPPSQGERKGEDIAWEELSHYENCPVAYAKARLAELNVMKVKVSIKQLSLKIEGDKPEPKLGKGTYTYWQREESMPDELALYSKKGKVGYVSKWQVMAYCRHHGKAEPFQIEDGNYRWVDVKVVGDLDAFLGEGKSCG